MKGNQEILFRKGMVIIFMTIFFVLNTKGDTIAPLKWRSSPSHVNFNLQQISNVNIDVEYKIFKLIL
jgi:hypothetical protein